MFLAPNCLGGELPEFVESVYKIDTGSDHVAKFRGDRPRELGDYALKKKKHHEHFIGPSVTPYGRPNNFSSLEPMENQCRFKSGCNGWLRCRKVI